MATGQTVIEGHAILHGGDHHVHAARRLSESFPRIEWRDGGEGPVVDLVEDPLLAEGAFRIDIAPERVTVSGGPFSGVIYGMEELIDRAAADPTRLELETGVIEGAPGLAYRTFWTWDHSTNWELSQVGQQEIGVFNPYGKPPGGFLARLPARRRLLFAAIASRPSSSTASCVTRTAASRRRRSSAATPPSAACASCPASPSAPTAASTGRATTASTWPLGCGPTRNTRRRWRRGWASRSPTSPSRSNFPKSDYTLSACPSAPGDHGLDGGGRGLAGRDLRHRRHQHRGRRLRGLRLRRCVARRANEAEAARRVDDFGDSWSHTDMADNFPRLYRTAKAIKPDLWLYSEIQWDNLLDPVAHEAQRRLPRGGIYQHTTNRSYWGRIQAELTRDYVEALPTQPNVLRCQFACQWNGDERSERYCLNARVFADMARLCADKRHAAG